MTASNGELEKDPIELRGWRRAAAVALGAFFVALPIFAYFDERMGILGSKNQSPDAFSLVMAIFVVLGGVLLLSGIIGVWLMWKDVGTLDRSSEPNELAIATKQVPTAQTLEAEHLLDPPFDGQWVQKSPGDADPLFAKAAENYFYGTLGEAANFDSEVRTVWRTKSGRPNWAFEVVTSSGPKWIKVPHRGKAGKGAGTAAE